jgi:hypothetical protein
MMVFVFIFDVFAAASGALALQDSRRADEEL